MPGAGAVTAETYGAQGQPASPNATNSLSDPLKLPPHLQTIFEQSYPHFSDAEYKRRRASLHRTPHGMFRAGQVI